MVRTRLRPLGVALPLVAGVGAHQRLKPSEGGGGLAKRMPGAATVPAGAVRDGRHPGRRRGTRGRRRVHNGGGPVRS